MERKTLTIGIGLGMLGAAGVGLGAMIRAGRRRRSGRAEPGKRASANDRSRFTPASFSGDIRGGGPGAGADLGRGGASTATGDLAGGGEPGSLVDFGDGMVTVRDAVPTGGAGAAVERPLGDRGAKLPTPDHHAPRTATRMAPGIPVGSGRGIDRALAQSDTDIGGGVAGDTTMTGAESEKGRDEQTIRNDDHDRTTL